MLLNNNNVTLKDKHFARGKAFLSCLYVVFNDNQDKC